MKIRIKMFLRSAEYRRMCLECIWGSFYAFLMTPVTYAQAIYKVWRIHRENPTRWDKYVAMKEFENKSEEKNKFFQVFASKMGAVHALTMMQISMTIRVGIRNGDVDPQKGKSPEENYANFLENKKKAIQEIDGLQEMCGDFSPIIRQMIEDCEIDMFDSYDDICKYFDVIHSYIAGDDATKKE